ncbi:hypothetical protein CI109_105284 [Kwoniella shandongensis]|uniref:Cytochrome oxidase assembly protein n=1 Tax=Kwoniella shandongensis TaxID=1734106 RepID=A0AAJ8LMX3_9TREE
MIAPGLARGLFQSLRKEVTPSRVSVRALSTQPLTRPTSRPFRLPYFTPSARSTYFYPSHTFTFPRPISTVTPPPPQIPRSLPYWLYGCSAVVFGIIVIGGLTRLTESGLSIVEWQPLTGVLPPITAAEWDAEWEKYRLSPEGVMTNANIDMHEFKKIFYMDFVIPTIYYLTRYKLPKPLPAKLMLIGLGIGFQGVLGWWMVKSGLSEEIVENNAVPRVSQYRLAAHLTAALALYLGMLSTAIGIQRDAKILRQPSIVQQLSLSSVKRFRGLVHTSGMMVFLTVVTGAFVAGLDAGLVYNEFPYMGEGFVPPTEELFDPRYAKSPTDKWWRNMLENPVTAQFDHRVLIPIKATRRLAALTTAAAVTQVTLGISTLLYLVPIPLAAMHQAGSVVLLTCIMALGGSIRRPSRMLKHLRR